jgi:signal transduction histidine kinase
MSSLWRRASKPRRRQYALRLLLLAAVYFVTAKWGLSLSAVSGFATFVWPPTGIGLAALLLLGRNLWPGIFLGAFFTNYTNGASPYLAFAIAIGNTLELAAGAYLLNRFGFQKNLQRIKDVVLLVGFGAVAPTLIAATIGTSSLLVANHIGIGEYPFTWLAWWVGDMLGILTIAPLLLVWSRRPLFRGGPKQLWEAIMLIVIFIIVSLAIFGSSTSSRSILAGSVYLLFSFLIWAALRFNVRFVSLLVLMLSAITVWASKYGRGPFLSVSLHKSLFASQLFIGATAVTFLTFSSVMSERKRAQATVQMLNLALEKSLSKTAAELRKEQELEKLREEFVATASHEIKTPITSIKARAQLLEKTLSGRGDSEAAQIAGGINRQADILTGLSDELMDVSKVAEGRFVLHKASVDIDALLPKIAAEFKYLAPDHRIVKRGSYKKSIPADKARIEQVVLNLLTNAVKYSPPKTKVVVGLRGNSRMVTVQVADQGPGISKKDQAKIFKRFYRTADRSSTKQAVSGLGLGLYIASEIIKQHGGKLIVDSRVGHGSTFSFTLPAKK